MNIMKYFGSKKKKDEDPDVKAAEIRAYENEMKEVNFQKKNAAMRAAAIRGKQKARGGSTSKTEKTAVKVGKGILSVGGKLMELGKYGTSLNWGNEPAPQRTQKTTGKKKKVVKTQHKQHDPFEMPEFPF